MATYLAMLTKFLTTTFAWIKTQFEPSERGLVLMVSLVIILLTPGQNHTEAHRTKPNKPSSFTEILKPNIRKLTNSLSLSLFRFDFSQSTFRR